MTSSNQEIPEVQNVNETIGPDKVVTFGSAAKYLGVRYQQVYQRVQRGRMKSTVVFGRKCVFLAEVEEWKDQRSLLGK